MTAIFFDLDGTLLPMDNDEFTRAYFALLVKTIAPLGYDPDRLVRSVWAGTKAMVKNDGTATNADRFWAAFRAAEGARVDKDIPAFDRFYETEFLKAVSATQPNPLAAEAVRAAREKADKVVLATNPIFPRSAVTGRMGWVGLKESDFDYITSYEVSHYCKPNPEYYRETARCVGVSPESCLMIGNDATEDIAAASAAGMRAFHVLDCAIGPAASLSGRFPDMIRYIEAL